MSRENFRREISRAFEAISGPPSPALSARVRSALADPRPSTTGTLWMAGVAAGLIAAIVVGVLVVANLNRHQTSIVPAGLGSPSPSAVASPAETPAASPAQTPPDSSLPPFVCATQSTLAGIQPPTVAFVDAVRVGTHDTYDRLTIEFQNGEPTSVDLRPQSGATYTQGASGKQVTLSGSAGLLVTIHGADEHTAYAGPIDFKTGHGVLIEVRQVQDFEGVVQWGFGLSQPGCYRAFFLGNPARLVIDISNG